MKTIILCATVTLLAAVAQAQNENVSWQTPAAISGASDVSTQGTFFGSWAPYDGSANTLPVNGVIFEGNSTLPGFSASFPSSDQNGYNGYNNPNTANANYNTLLQTATYADSGSGTIVITWSDTPGHTYLIQAWANDGRGNSRSETFTGGANTSATLDFGDAPGQYITGTYVADSSGSETITLSGTGSPNGDYPQINLLQVRDITSTTVTNYQSAVLSDNPLGYWSIDLTDPNASSGVATDLTGNGNDGTYYGITPSGNLVAGPAPYITNAASFSNTGYVYLGNGNNLNYLNFTGPTTIEAWAQPASLSPPANADIVAKGYDGSYNDQEIALRQDPSGNPYYGYFGTGGLSGGQQNTSWVYLVLANDGSNDYLYINGVLVASTPDTTGSISFSELVPWAIGNGTLQGNGRSFYGNICQVAIYNYGLSSAQVLKHYFEAEVNASPAASKPIIAAQPQSQSGFVGGSVTFSVTALSGLSTTNQWYEGSTPLQGQTNSSLTLNNLQLTNAGSYSVVVGNANGTTNSASATLTVNTPNHLQWTANDNNGQWDVDTSANWLNISNDTQTVFNQGDNVLFDDTPGVPTSVTVNGTVVPSLITVNTSTNSFSISSGTISGSGSLVKLGTSPLSITSSQGLAGTATIGGGSLYAGNNCLNAISAIVVSNNATLDFGGGQFGSIKPVTISGAGLNGEGALYNSYSDYPVELLNITMAGNSTLGGSARWDLASGSQITGPYDLTVDWSGGAGYGQWNSVTIGANVPQITVTNAGTLGFTGMDSSCQNPATVLDISSTNSQVTIYSGGFNGNVNVESGAEMTLASGNQTLESGTIHIYSGGTLYLDYQGNTLTGNNLILENGASLQTFYNNGVESIENQVTLNGVAHFVLGDHSENFSNVISGAGGFVLNYYNNEMVFSSSNTYSGPTIIGSSGSTPEVALAGNGSITHSSLIFFGGDDPTVGHMDVSSRSDQTLTLASGQTLEGVGGITGSLVVSSGAILSPGGTNTTISMTTGSNPVGVIAASDNVTLSGTTVIKLDGATNDAVDAAAGITYGGALNLANISGSPLAAGNTFQIFSAASYSGSFSSISPTTPGVGLAWNTTQLSSGIISVVSSGGGPVIGTPYVSGGNLIFSGAGGSDNGTYYVLTSTNLLTPLAQWTPIATNMYTGTGGFSVTNALSGGTHRFYIIKQ